jgi:Helix-turn-helix domain
MTSGGGWRSGQAVKVLRLSLDEREEISRGLAAGESLRAIASRLSRAPSTVSREVARNRGRSRYRALPAERAAWRRACRPKQTKLSPWPGLPCTSTIRARSSHHADQRQSWMLAERITVNSSLPTTRFLLWTAGAVVLFEWLMSVDLDAMLSKIWTRSAGSKSGRGGSGQPGRSAEPSTMRSRASLVRRWLNRLSAGRIALVSGKSERGAARSVVGDYHHAQLGELVAHVGEAVDRYRAGELDAFDVDHVLLQYSQAAKEL